MLVASFLSLSLRSLLRRRHCRHAAVLEMRHDQEVAADSDAERREFLASFGGQCG